MKDVPNTCDLQLILASGSQYKQCVLSKLGIPFNCFSPDIDESQRLNESPENLVSRLACAKAEKAYLELSKHGKTEPFYVIGVDQVAVHNNNIIGKSGSIEVAIQQLSEFSGHKVTFATGVCLLNHQGRHEVIVEPYEVEFKNLSQNQIIQYVQAEMPLDCAGSFKCEGQGILLFTALCGRDPNALIGMPLIALQELFSKFGVDLFDYIQ